MNFLSTAAFSSVCALIYKYKKNIKGAIIGLVASVFSMTAMMVALNLFVTPLYTGMPMETIASMIPTLFLPFNFTKAVLNAALVLMLYKPISRALKTAKIIGISEDNGKTENFSGKATSKNPLLTNLLVLGIGFVFVALSVVVFIVVLGGKFTFMI